MTNRLKPCKYYESMQRTVLGHKKREGGQVFVRNSRGIDQGFQEEWILWEFEEE